MATGLRKSRTGGIDPPAHPLLHLPLAGREGNAEGRDLAWLEERSGGALEVNDSAHLGASQAARGALGGGSSVLPSWA